MRHIGFHRVTGGINDDAVKVTDIALHHSMTCCEALGFDRRRSRACCGGAGNVASAAFVSGEPIQPQRSDGQGDVDLVSRSDDDVAVVADETHMGSTERMEELHDVPVAADTQVAA